MAMPTKGTRLIVVDGAKYRWTFSSNARSRNVSNREIIIELAESPKSKLITSPAGIDEWFGDDYEYEVTPALIETGIRRAIESGWDPNSGGTFLLFNDGAFCSPDPRRIK